MPITTAPRKIKKTEQFVTIPRKEYEELLIFKKLVPVFKPTKSELRALERGRKEFEDGNYVSWEELKHELADRRGRPRKKTT